MDDSYYLQEDGEQTGPYTFEELIEKEPDIHTRVLSTAQNTWCDACDLPELYEYFRNQGVYFPTENNLASFWIRLAAFVIDIIIMSLIFDLVLSVLATRMGINMQSFTSMQAVGKMPAGQLMTIQISFNIILILYNSICEASALRGSLGKRAFGLIVVNSDGLGPSLLIALIRSFGKMVSLFFWGLGFLSIFFTEHRQALHDYVAKTYVIRKNA